MRVYRVDGVYVAQETERSQTTAKLSILPGSAVPGCCLVSLRGPLQGWNGQGALAEYPEVARVDSARDQEGESGHTVCRQYFLRTSFEFADLAPH